MMQLEAVLFDCDGVLAETERDGHRVAYNLAFSETGLDINWSSVQYANLLKISGGKERMWAFFSSYRERYPESVYGYALIEKLYARKTHFFKQICRDGKMPARTGVVRLIKELHNCGIMLFVCSTSHRDSVSELIRSSIGELQLGYFTELLCGDIVKNKKPAPDIYLLAKDKYSLNPSRCIVIEDSRNGLEAAISVGMRCVVTPSVYTENEDFSGASLVVSCLGDSGHPCKVLRGPSALDGISLVGTSQLETVIERTMQL